MHFHVYYSWFLGVPVVHIFYFSYIFCIYSYCKVSEKVFLNKNLLFRFLHGYIPITRAGSLLFFFSVLLCFSSTKQRFPTVLYSSLFFIIGNKDCFIPAIKCLFFQLSLLLPIHISSAHCLFLHWEVLQYCFCPISRLFSWSFFFFCWVL